MKAFLMISFVLAVNAAAYTIMYFTGWTYEHAAITILIGALAAHLGMSYGDSK